MNGIAYYNGIFSTTDKIGIPLSDRSVFFGDGIYDAALVHRGSIYLKASISIVFSEAPSRLVLIPRILKTDFPVCLLQLRQWRTARIHFCIFS